MSFECFIMLEQFYSVHISVICMSNNNDALVILVTLYEDVMKCSSKYSLKIRGLCKCYIFV